MDLYRTHADMLRRIAAFVASRPGVPEPVISKYRKLADPVSGPRIARLLQYDLDVAGCNVVNRVVLDAGCGTGIWSVLLGLLQASRVVGIDMFPANIECLNQIGREFALPIEARHGDVIDSGIASGSVGLVYCVEAISHFHDWGAFLDEGARVLAPAGVVIIGDGNNGANPIIKQGIFDFWEKTEVGPFAPGDSHTDQNLPYVFRRWMIVRKNFPAATDEQVYTLGLHTSHLGGAELVAAGREYLATGKLPGPPYRRGQSLVRPEDCQHNEEPVHPAAIVRRLRQHGLVARSRAHFGLGRSPLLPLVNRVAAGFGSLPLLVSPRYLVIARRR